MSLGILFAVLLGLISIGMPIALAITAGAIAFAKLDAQLLDIGLILSFVTGLLPFPLLSIPLFILAGELMNISGVTRRIMDFAATLTGHVPGGLAQVNVVVSTLKGGMSGSATADAAMDAKMLVPEMVRRGYDPAFCAGVTATSSFTSAMLPPSIGLLMFGFVTDTSVGALFVGGIVPAIILTLAFMATVHFLAVRYGYGADLPRATWGQVGEAFVKSLPGLMLPVIIIVGIRFGYFTASEAGAIAVCYALAFCLLTGETSLREIYGAFKNTAVISSVIMVVLAATGALSFALTFESVPQRMAEGLISITSEPHLLLIIILLFLLLVGIFIEGLPMILILAPMFMPAVTAAGIDPVVFGELFCMMCLIGGVSPPVGAIMFVTCSITGVGMGPFFRACLPFLAATFAVIGLIIAFPQLVTWFAYL